jgi:hypothetical protein
MCMKLFRKKWWKEEYVDYVKKSEMNDKMILKKIEWNSEGKEHTDSYA